MNDTRLLVSSIIRITEPGERSGSVRLVSLKERRVLADWPIPESPFRAYDPNPRGGLRGGRGISGDGERLVVAVTDRLFVFNREWRQVGELSHPLLGQVHDLLVEPDGVWVTASASDMVMKLGWDGAVLRAWSWREDPALARELKLADALGGALSDDYRDPRRLPAFFDFVHVNGVARCPEGLLVSFGFVPSRLSRRIQALTDLPDALLRRLGRGTRKTKASSAFDLRFLASSFTASSWVGVLLPDQGPARVVARQDGILRPNHNLLRHRDTLVYNDTHNNQVVQQAVDGSWKRQVAIPGDPPFVRGLAPLGGNRFLVGSQRPAALYDVDFDSPRCERLLELGTHRHECVYGIHVVPDCFGEPPEELWAPASPANNARPRNEARVA
ncbi:hypothetical protein HUA76_23760 [Myxococcus sp. CA056]|uniref:hypothetical protein n=1 Tax=unclassified Myxococcus TaxID=2648731 RepID=UPI00157B63C1|nr:MULTISPECIES: hypothetical protein [unclassified Myxococcus]NTX13826.1 hypothetical protein [Myxococcus sp. CA056]NTX38495.1 hypothetical protein [Myxococcus sp. CA033]